MVRQAENNQLLPSRNGSIVGETPVSMSSKVSHPSMTASPNPNAAAEQRKIEELRRIRQQAKAAEEAKAAQMAQQAVAPAAPPFSPLPSNQVQSRTSSKRLAEDSEDEDGSDEGSGNDEEEDDDEDAVRRSMPGGSSLAGMAKAQINTVAYMQSSSPRNELNTSLKRKQNTLIKNQQMILLGYDEDAARVED